MHLIDSKCSTSEQFYFMQSLFYFMQHKERYVGLIRSLLYLYLSGIMEGFVVKKVH